MSVSMFRSSSSLIHLEAKKRHQQQIVTFKVLGYRDEEQRQGPAGRVTAMHKDQGGKIETGRSLGKHTGTGVLHGGANLAPSSIASPPPSQFPSGSQTTKAKGRGSEGDR